MNVRNTCWQARYGGKFTSINFTLIKSSEFHFPADVAEQYLSGNKIPIATPGEPDVPRKRLKQRQLGIQRAQIWLKSGTYHGEKLKEFLFGRCRNWKL